VDDVKMVKAAHT